MTAGRSTDRAQPYNLDPRSGTWVLANPGVSVRPRNSEPWLVVEVEGEMDLQAMPLIADVVGGASPLVVFELSAVTFMDSSGLGVLEQTQRRAVAAGGRVSLVAPSKQVRRVLELTGSEREFPTFDSVEEAVSVPFGAAGEPELTGPPLGRR